MIFLAIAAAATLLFLALTFIVRSNDLPQTPPEPPEAHLEARKASIYENLRDLQFEFRLGKLSDEDYARAKNDLQGELGIVLAEIDRVKAGVVTVPVEETGLAACPHCGAIPEKVTKFCGECGKPMKVNA